MIDPETARAPDRDAMERAVGFTGYLRCRKCNAGGPWKLPTETLMYLTAMMIADLSEMEDVPMVFGTATTFDGYVMRYATDGEAHLKKLIDREPERAFLWTRLGNLYGHAELYERAQPAYERALELDPKDIEAHGMLAHLLCETGRSLEGVPHWHAVLKHVRDARQVNTETRRHLVREAIENLLQAHAESKGKIDLLPEMTPELLKGRPKDEPVVLELREVDLGSEKGLKELCDMFLGPPRRRVPNLFGRRSEREPEMTDDRPPTPVHRESRTVGRNEPCPCGSGRKYKKCCGR
jgi:hypothetical protein